MPGSRRWLHELTPLIVSAALTLSAILHDPRFVCAEETAPGGGVSAPEGVLVLRNGGILSGTIAKSASQYEVKSHAGTMVVPESIVKLQAANLNEAYLQLRASAESQGGANGRIALAQWCLTNHLEKEACRELRDALELEPDRTDAKRLLRSAEEALQASEKPARAAPAPDPARSARQSEGATDDAVTLGGLSRERALQFARRIQPMLVNNCTAAGCHGRDSQSGFRLSKVTPGKDASRHAAERNLAEILEQIDFEKPRTSRLLTAPRGNHGRRGRPIFPGSRGEEQLAELTRWVAAVATEESHREERRGAPPRAQNEQVAARGAAIPPDRSVSSKADPFASAPIPVARSSAQRTDQSSLTSGKNDPFDPASFNRAAAKRSGP